MSDSDSDDDKHLFLPKVDRGTYVKELYLSLSSLSLDELNIFEPPAVDILIIFINNFILICTFNISPTTWDITLEVIRIFNNR